LQFDVDQAAWQRLLARRLCRTVLMTNRLDWSVEQAIAGYSGRQQIERVFRGLNDGNGVGWGPMYHWTDSRIRVHAFYCLPGVSQLQVLHKKAGAVWPGLSMEQLLEELAQIRQFDLLYPPQGEKGPPRVATELSKQTLRQHALAEALGLDRLRITPRG
jgi:precorrin-6B methylase 1